MYTQYTEHSTHYTVHITHHSTQHTAHTPAGCSDSNKGVNTHTSALRSVQSASVANAVRERVEGYTSSWKKPDRCAARGTWELGNVKCGNGNVGMGMWEWGDSGGIVGE
jgi:hypothetical protein